jgi:hypothetical protein
MPGRGPQTFKKRQKEQERRERQQEKFAKRLQRKAQRGTASEAGHDDSSISGPEAPDSTSLPHEEI